jgi:hypothetical protein
VAPRFSAARLRLALVAGLAVLTIAPLAHAGRAPQAQAGLLPSCGGLPEFPFARWGDFAPYTLVRDGTFEAGGSGWSLAGGARVVEGNEPFYVHGRGENRSLLLPRGSSATSPPVCMSLGRPTMRFFAASAGSGQSAVRVEVVSRNLLGILSVIDGGVVSGDSGWQPTPRVSLLGSNLASLLWTTSVQLRFRAVSNSSRLDDVYVDPWVIR